MARGSGERCETWLKTPMWKSLARGGERVQWEKEQSERSRQSRRLQNTGFYELGEEEEPEKGDWEEMISVDDQQRWMS